MYFVLYQKDTCRILTAPIPVSVNFCSLRIYSTGSSTKKTSVELNDESHAKNKPKRTRLLMIMLITMMTMCSMLSAKHKLINNGYSLDTGGKYLITKFH